MTRISKFTRTFCRNVRINLIVTATFLVSGIALGAEPHVALTDRIFNVQALDTETIKAFSLEVLLSERLGRVIEASGIHPNDYRSTVNVHISKAKIAKPADDPQDSDQDAVNKADKKNKKNSDDDAADDSNEDDLTDMFGSSFKKRSMLDANNLIKMFRKARKKERLDGAIYENFNSQEAEDLEDSDADESGDEDGDVDQEPEVFEFPVDDIYIQTAIADPLF